MVSVELRRLILGESKLQLRFILEMAKAQGLTQVEFNRAMTQVFNRWMDTLGMTPVVPALPPAEQSRLLS